MLRSMGGKSLGVAAALLGALVVLASVLRVAEPASAQPARPNLILIVTDDQTVDMMSVMPNTRTLLGGKGVTFTNAFAATPLCCPSRAGLLTGQYSSKHGVLDNDGPNGGVSAFNASSTLATWLRDSGYRTSLIGKYFNGYEKLANPGVPPGWDDWHGFIAKQEYASYNYNLNSNGTIVSYGQGPGDYLTDVMTTKAVDVIRNSSTKQFFMYFAPFAPHWPGAPKTSDFGKFEGTPPWRPPSYDRADPGTHAGRLPPLPGYLQRIGDRYRPRGLESLLALERAVATILNELRVNGKLSRTVIAFTSDNGHMWGEHRIMNKTWAYEPSIRVPLIIRAPWLTQAYFDDRLVVNLDLTATFLELATVSPPIAQEGRSLVPLLLGTNPAWRNEVKIEYRGDRTNDYFSPKYRAIRTAQYKLVDYDDGERELYDLLHDPHELTDLSEDPAMRSVEQQLLDRLENL